MTSKGLLESLLQDLRYGARQLRSNPGFTLVAVVSLALGIGANTAIFQLLNAVRLRTRPVERPEQLVEVRLPPGSSRSGRFTGGRSNLTNPLWEQIRQRQEAFSGVFAWCNGRFNLASGGEARNAEGLWVSGDFFRTLGVQARLGRLFTVEDDRRGCGSPGAVISHGFWLREYGGDPGVLGRSVTLDDHPFPIIGVTPPGFFGVEVGRTFDVAVLLCSDPVLAGEASALDKRWYWWLAVMGRVKPGWSLERVNAHLAAIAPGAFEATLPEIYQPDMAKRYLASKLVAEAAGRGVSSLRAQYESPLWMLMSTAGLVLLIACANIANLMLVRATAREREFAIRLALGASRLRLIRQVLAESLMLAIVGTGLGAALAQVLSRSLVAFLKTGQRSLALDVPVDWRVLAFAAAVAALTCILFGLAPALRAVRTAPGAAIKAGSRGLTASRERFGVRRVLVVSQVALCLVLLVGALLFVRSLRNLLSVDPGFRPEGVMAASIALPPADYPADRRAGVRQELLDRMRAISGIGSVSEVAIVPVSGSGWNNSVKVDGETGEYRESYFNRVGPEYFKTMRTTLLAGREIGARDTAASTPVAIVNEAFAHRFFNGAVPIGRRFRVEPQRGEPEEVYEIVGFVRDSKYRSLRDEFRPTAFLAAAQDKQPGTYVQYAIHSRAPLQSSMTAIKQVLRQVNAKAVVQFTVMDAQIRDSLLRERLMATLTGFFGALAVLIAVVGLYGVISYMVACRRGEIGIRMALGAGRATIVRMVLREACVLVALGLAIGIGAALAAARAVGSILFGMTPSDPTTLALAVGGLAAVALAASYVPARRAAAVEPMLALREE
jgi:predicted permease